jgi:hypothetical protein
MTEFLEKLLNVKTENTSSNILYTQWVLDRKSISKAISTIPLFFPHYTLHDESHSDTILNRIVRILGKEVFNEWSATDIWLLLESAYSHDLGMVVNAEDLTNCFNSKTFTEYVLSITADSTNPLYDYAKCFEVNGDKVKVKECPLTVDIYDSIKYIVAGYFRPTHADRSKEIISKPHARKTHESTMSLIPNRIYKLLSDICLLHTRGFDEVMKLPFKEVGVEYDNAHPRLIACLLRLGDLLDLDNNRYSEVFLRMVKTLPIDSTWHLKKIMSIVHFRLDSSLVEVTAECEDYNTQDVTQQWFNCLNSEYVNQQLTWHEIVPCKSYGNLPNIGGLKVVLKGYELIDSKNKPMFSIDPEKALSLLHGTGLYANRSQCIRELLQNSVDATIIKLWLEFGEESNTWKDAQEFAADERVKNSFVEVRINKMNEVKYEDNILWSAIITDKGYGMSSDDLKYLIIAGSSDKNTVKNSIVRKMPEWLKPSGIFGIGFQSVFELTECVTLDTKSYLDEEAFVVELTKPQSKRRGEVLIKKVITSHKRKPGIKLQFEFCTKRHRTSWSVSFQDTYKSRYIQNFDPTESTSFDYDMCNIIEEVGKFNEYSYIPIKLFIDDNELELPKSLWHGSDCYYVSETGMEVIIYPYNRFNDAYYRNQPVKWNYTTEFISCSINILRGSATDILTMNRNEFQSTYKSEFNYLAIKSMFIAIKNNLAEYNKDSKLRIPLSMFIEYYWDYHEKGQFDKDDFSKAWQDIEFRDENGKGIPILNILDADTIRILFYTEKQPFPYEIDNKANLITLHINPMHSTIIDNFKFLLKLLSRNFKGIKYATPANADSCKEEIQVSKAYIDDPIDEALLRKTLNLGKHSMMTGSRMIIPCMQKYSALRIKRTDDSWYMEESVRCFYLQIEHPIMVSPFVYKLEENGHTRTLSGGNGMKLHEWVYKNRINSNTTLGEIETTYSQFVEDFRDVLPLP